MIPFAAAVTAAHADPVAASTSEGGTYIGGPQPRDEFERAVPETPRRRPGLFVVDLDEAMIGTVTLDRRDTDRPGPVSPDTEEVHLG